jgi:hypothetical protein
VTNITITPVIRSLCRLCAPDPVAWRGDEGKSEWQRHGPERKAAAPGTHIAASKRKFVRGRPVVRWLAMLYFAYFFFMPAYRHSFAAWMEFTDFYAAFVLLYFLVAELTGRLLTVAFV